MSGSNGEDFELISMPSVDSLAEWRCCEQVENGTPSTSSSFWDDESEDGSGARPSDLFGRLTWKIENYSLTNKRELRSKIFEAGDYKWCVLIYPQGCDVSHHLSLFLCVANHDRLLPGWGHFAQFTIALVNKDPKKSKYSDTLHRFWKKEHDWGWKKFMELTKLPDGFIVSDTLVIKAKVQVIREKAHRLFRCLNFQYRRELVRVYLSHVEQICRRFFEEKRDKLGKLIEDRLLWISFCSFWSGIDQDTKRHMSSDKTDVIFKVVVKHFFVEKEVTSTLVMDSLYSGLKVLEYQSRNKKGRQELLGTDESPSPLIHIEKDMFVLADDVLVLLQRVALEPLPCQPLAPKDDSNSQNRLKEGSCGDILYRDSIEREERRLTELGRKTLEFFVLSHIFKKIEVAYQEAIALQMQEELIREEEAEIELKAKCGASAKEKRTKKKQAKQRQSNRKGKDRGKNEKLGGIMDEKHKEDDKPSGERSLGALSLNLVQPDLGGIEGTDNISDVSYNGGDGSVALLTDLEDRDSISVNWEVVDISEIPPITEASNNEKLNGQMERRSPSIVDDSSSTCSTDSVPSVVLNGPYKGHSLPSNKIRTSLNRGKHERNEDVRSRAAAVHGGNDLSSGVAVDAGRLCDIIDRVKDTDYEEALLSFKDQIQWLKQHRVEKESEASSQQRKSSVKDDQLDVQRPSKPRKEKFQPSTSHAKELSVSQQMKQSSKSTLSSGTTSVNESASMREATLNLDEESLFPVTRSRRTSISANSEDTMQETITVVARSRPSGAALVSDSNSEALDAFTVQTLQNEANRSGMELSNYGPQLDRNCVTSQNAATLSLPSLCSSGEAASCSSLASSPSKNPSQTTGREVHGSGISFGSLDQYIGDSAPEVESGGTSMSPSNYQSANISSGVSCLEVQEVILLDDFPHLDIINDLLNEDQIVGGAYYHVDDESSSGGFYVFPKGDAGQPSAQFYDGRFQGFYSSSGADFGGLGLIDARHYHEYLAACESGIRSQWPQFSGGDFSMLGVDGADVVYPYQLQDYSSNLAACGFSGYDTV